MNLIGNSIRLREMGKNDLEFKVRWFNDPLVNKTLILSEKINRKKTARWFEKAVQDPSRLDLVIETLDGNPLGIIGFVNMDPNHRTAESFIVIGEKDYWGKGIMIEAMSLLLKWSFHTLALDKIWALALPDNIASIITMKKLGYQIEGTLRQEKCLAGKRVDILRMGLLRCDFKDIFSSKDK